jgi:acetylornithine deacetylase/succinyl-diaminopimelate desuccinylase-like protein
MNLSISDRQFQSALDRLGEFVSIPCVSNPGSEDYDVNQLQKAADFVFKELRKLDFHAEKISVENSAPFVFAECITDASLPTLLLYGHYDVQPVDREKWNTDPFVVVTRDDRIYGRGSSDDKGGIIAILAALNVYKEANIKLPVNIKILFEGEEEYGSVHLEKLIKIMANRLYANALIVMDGMNRDVETGTLSSSTRGLVMLKMRVDALVKPTHSGVGCLCPDPAQALCKLISSLSDPSEIPGIMEEIQSLSNEEAKMLRAGSESAETYFKNQGVVAGAKLRGDPALSIDERIVLTPSISVNNMTCGKPNGGNSIQDYAEASIGIRILPGQDPNKVAKKVIEYLQSQKVMWDLPVKVYEEEEGNWGWKARLDGGYTKLYLDSMAEHFPKVAPMPCGGALPLLRLFEERFPNMEMLIPGVEDPDTSAHSHNESQSKSLLRHAINSLITFIDRSGL